MEISNITIGQDATKRLLDGVKTAVQGIRYSYGPAGLNASVETEMYPYSQTINDANIIIQAITVSDPIAKIGLNYVKELSAKADKDSADGRKTTCIIAEEIIERGLASSLKPIQLKRELDEMIPLIEEIINETKKDISVEDVEKVATIAGESLEIGKIVGEIYKKIGKDGIVHVEGSGTYSTSFSVIEGVRFMQTGFLSPYMVHDEEAKKLGQKECRAVYENPTILVTKRKISHLNDINPVIESMNKNGKKDLVIFTDDMDSGVASIMVKAHRDRIMNILIIKAPVLWKNYVFEDFAKVTNSTIIEDATGLNFKNLPLSALGTCDRIIVDEDETVVMGGADISEHIANLENKNTDDSLLRLSWLRNKTAILKLGANNESELSYKRLKTADAINSARLALKDGVVVGGGKCLSYISELLPNNEINTILREALKAPFKQICLNMGVNDFNTENVYDAAKVVKNAVRNGIALASTVLTAGIVIHLPPKQPTEQKHVLPF